MGRAAGVEVLCWRQGWKGWKGQARVILQLARYLRSFLLEAAKAEAGGNRAVSKRYEKSAYCDPVPAVSSCGSLGRRCSGQRKERLFFSPRRTYMVLYDHRSAGEGWLETREKMGAAGELQLCRSPSAQQCEQAWRRGCGRPVEVTHPVKFPPRRDEAKFSPFSC